MKFVGVSDWKDHLIGFGCDGTNVNLAYGGSKGHLEQAVPMGGCILVPRS